MKIFSITLKLVLAISLLVSCGSEKTNQKVSSDPSGRKNSNYAAFGSGAPICPPPGGGAAFTWLDDIPKMAEAFNKGRTTVVLQSTSAGTRAVAATIMSNVVPGLVPPAPGPSLGAIACRGGLYTVIAVESAIAIYLTVQLGEALYANFRHDMAATGLDAKLCLSIRKNLNTSINTCPLPTPGTSTNACLTTHLNDIKNLYAPGGVCYGSPAVATITTVPYAGPPAF